MKLSWRSSIFSVFILCVWFYLNGGKDGILSQSRLLISSISRGSVTVTVYNNGMSTDGVQLSIPPAAFEEDFAAFLSKHIHVKLHGSDEAIIADRVYNGEGQLVQAFADLVPDMRLYVVPPGLLFPRSEL